MAELTPEEVEAEHEAFMGKCMQEKLAAMPDMSERRKACQAEWEASHPVLAQGARPVPPPSSTPPRP